MTDLVALVGKKMRIASAVFSSSPHPPFITEFRRALAKHFRIVEYTRANTNLNNVAVRQIHRNWLAWGDMLMVDDTRLLEHFESVQTMEHRYIKQEKAMHVTHTTILLQVPEFSEAGARWVIDELNRGLLAQHLRPAYRPVLSPLDRVAASPT